MPVKNESHERIVAMIIARGGRCQWHTRVPRVGMLEAWIVVHRTALERAVPEIIVLLAFDGGRGCEVFSNRDVPNMFDEIETWLAAGPVR